MAVPSWPAGVPSMPMLDTYSNEPFLEPIRTEMEGGNVRLRRRPGDNVAIIQQSVRMTFDQYGALVTWGKETIGGWTGRFSVSVWLGSGCATKVCQFHSGAPRPTKRGGKIIAQMALRVYGV